MNGDAVIQRINDASLDPALWSEVIHDLSAYLGDRPLMFGVQWLPRGMSFIRTAHLPQIHIETMKSRYADINSNPMMSAALGMMAEHEALSMEAVLPLSEFEQTDYHKDAVAPMGGLVGDYLIAHKLLPNRFTATILARRPDQPSADAEIVARLEAISPHLGHAMEVMIRLGHLSASYDALDQVLCRLPQAICLCDQGGSLVFANAAMEQTLRADDRLTVRDGYLRAADPEADRKLSALISAALADPEAFAEPIEIGRAGNTALSVAIHPINTGIAETLGLGHARAIIFVNVFDPLRQDLVVALGEHFRLSEKQIRVLRHIVIGRNGPEIAESLGISANTLKTHVSRIYEKTGTRSREDLFRLMLTMSSH